MTDEYDEYLEQSSSSNRRVAVLILAIVLVVIATVFVFQNTEEATVEFLFLSGQAPLHIVIIISMALGSLLTMILGGARRKRKRRRAG